MSSTKTKRQKSIVTVSQVFKVQYKKYTKILVHLCMCVCVSMWAFCKWKNALVLRFLPAFCFVLSVYP